MNEILLGTMLATPLALAAMVLLRRCSAILPRLAAWAAVPALLLAFCRPFTVDVSWLLLDSRLGLDPVGRVFLAVTAVLWLAAGWYAGSYLARDARRHEFQFFFLLTMTGNLGVTVAQDVVSFLAFFTLMSLAAYGLIVHDRRPASLRAGQVYLVMTVAGEMLLFAGSVLLFHETHSLAFDGLPARLAASPRCGIVVGLLLAGFGIKLGVMPLHGWLPLAHPAAPTPASAVLSGAIIKTGLLGYLRMLPLGADALPGWSDVCVGVGLVTCVLAALIGMTQRNPKAVLAYSSVSQMGLVTVCLGAALAAPAAWSTVSTALLLWVVHHAVAKAALFLGVGVAGAKMPCGSVRGHGGGVRRAAGIRLGRCRLADARSEDGVGCDLADGSGRNCPGTASRLPRFAIGAWPDPGSGRRHRDSRGRDHPRRPRDREPGRGGPTASVVRSGPAHRRPAGRPRLGAAPGRADPRPGKRHRRRPADRRAGGRSVRPVAMVRS
jgi:NADH:ubiquinone oxidoreductase subunit 5 (subunit L)/multisubunit Na+/H+ antiporter MnhA subunit